MKTDWNVIRKYSEGISRYTSSCFVFYNFYTMIPGRHRKFNPNVNREAVNIGRWRCWLRVYIYRKVVKYHHAHPLLKDFLVYWFLAQQPWHRRHRISSPSLPERYYFILILDECILGHLSVWGGSLLKLFPIINLQYQFFYFYLIRTVVYCRW